MKLWHHLALVVLAVGAYYTFVYPQPGKGNSKIPHELSYFSRRPWFSEEANGGEYAEGSGLLRGKVAIVTGSSSGIGKAVAFELYKLGCTVVVTSRREERAVKAVKWMQEAASDIENVGSLEPIALDLSDLDDVRRFAENFLQTSSQLHFLVENAGMAGLAFGWKGPWVSKQGYEMLYAANYLGHFLLLQLLLPLLQESSGRVTATSSIFHWGHDSLPAILPRNQLRSDENEGFGASMRQYGNTKMGQVLMCFEMQRRFPDVPCTPVAPGLINSGISNLDLESRGGDDFFLCGRSTKDGAQTTLHALLSKDLGKEVFLQPYYSPLHQSPPVSRYSVVLWEPISQILTWGLYQWTPHPHAYNATFAERLWDDSARACGTLR